MRLYSAMLATLEKHCDSARLGELFAQLRSSGESRSLPLADDADVQRMLSRIGVVPPGAGAAAAGKLAEECVRSLAQAVSRTPAQISLVLRLYASGLYGIMPRPVCGQVPRCKECGLSRDCEYYNAPPKRTGPDLRSPVKRVERDGAAALSDEEVVAVLLGGNRPTDEHLKLAKTLIKRYGGVRRLAAVSYGELLTLRGVGQAAALRLAAAGEYYSRVISERMAAGPAVRSGKDFYDLYYPMLRDLKKEVFMVVLLDQKNRVMRSHKVSEGTLTASLIHPREVFSPAIRESAAAVAFVHNHPSGDSSPSPEDREITRRLVETAKLVGIRVLDHVIVGESAYTSFLDEGILD